MSTKPTAKKFRLRKPNANAPQASEDETLAAHDDGFSGMDFRKPADKAPQKASQQPAAAPKQAPQQTGTKEEEIAKIRAEGHTGRKLRTARRVAQRHGITAENDFDAVRQLRAKGIDPFGRSNMLEVVGGQESENLPEKAKPKAVGAAQKPAPVDEGTRAAEIMRIQRDIARRRRRQVALLSVRLFLFVMMPTLITSFYFYAVATRMYATKSEFVIQQAGSAAGGAGGGLGSLFSGTGLATQQDSISVQSYLLSRDAMKRLDEDYGFRSHFSTPQIDRLQRLKPDATQEEAFSLYKRMVKIGYDPTEGLIKMEVIAANPRASQLFSEALIAYAEEQVDHLTSRLRNDQMRGARDSFVEADRRLVDAQTRVVQLQEQLGVVSPEAEISSQMGQISAIEGEIRTQRLRLDQILSNAQPNRTRVQVIQSNIAALEDELSLLRQNLTTGTATDASLARIAAELGVAEVDLQTRTALLQQAAQQLEMARIEANRQVRYLSTSVPPIAPDEPTYPKPFENTLLAFLVFSGIYLMISLTASILREQVSG